MKVLMVVDTAPPLYGGAGNQAVLLAKHLGPLGVDVSIYARQKMRVRSARGSSVRFAQPYLGNSTLSSMFFAISVGLRVLFTSADIVHFHGAYLYSGVGLAVARTRGIKSVLKVTLLGSDDPAAVFRVRRGPFHVGKILVKQFEAASVVIALNNTIAEEVAAVVPKARVVVIPNGVSMPDREPTPGASNDEPRVMYCGKVTVRKGIDTLLAAWDLFRTEFPAASLTLIGPIGRSLSNQLADAHALGRRGITTTGYVPPSSTSTLLRSGNVFVLPSRAEGQPNALIEAMSLGLACCISNIPVNVATAQNAATRFDVGSPEGLAAGLQEAWQKRSTLGPAGRARASEFDIENVADTYSRMYHELTAGRIR